MDRRLWTVVCGLITKPCKPEYSVNGSSKPHILEGDLSTMTHWTVFSFFLLKALIGVDSFPSPENPIGKISPQIVQDGFARKFLLDDHGAIIRGDTSKKEIALVLTGDDFADGGTNIRSTLKKHRVRASFFLTGNFYANPSFKKLVGDLRKDGHYLGAHSDKHLLYADWTKRDSLLVSEDEFKKDLLSNYEKLAAYGIKVADAPYFLPPYEWYNSRIAQWTKQLGLHLVNFSPGTRSAADYTYPEMADRYRSSDEIYRSIISFEEKDPHGLNGFILLIHIGTDPRRTDKFYYKLDALLAELKIRNYKFTTITELLE